MYSAALGTSPASRWSSERARATNVLVVTAEHVGRRRQQLEILRRQRARFVGTRQRPVGVYPGVLRARRPAVLELLRRLRGGRHPARILCPCRRLTVLLDLPGEGIAQVDPLRGLVARAAQVSAPRLLLVPDGAEPQTQKVGRCVPSTTHGRNAIASSPSFAQTVCQSSLSLRRARDEEVEALAAAMQDHEPELTRERERPRLGAVPQVSARAPSPRARPELPRERCRTT